MVKTAEIGAPFHCTDQNEKKRGKGPKPSLSIVRVPKHLRGTREREKEWG